MQQLKWERETDLVRIHVVRARLVTTETHNLSERCRLYSQNNHSISLDASLYSDMNRSCIKDH